ncbi:MAG: heavy metal translocating P-type ATPase [Clostridia bacterium]|nr:heavy metal translocating P-type ATPase [Clostridia bacterium]
MKQNFNVTGMTCSACSSHVEKAVAKAEGVVNVAVSLMTNSMTVEYNEAVTGDAAIIAVVEHAGYGASVKGEQKTQSGGSAAAAVDHAAEERHLKATRAKLFWSIGLLIPLMYVSMGHMIGLPLPAFLSGTENAVSFAFTQFLIAIPILILNGHYFTNGFKRLFSGAPNMDSLIAVGSSAALVYGIFAIYRMSYGLGIGDLHLVHSYHMDLYFESSAMIVTLVGIGKYMEEKSKGRAKDAISKLIDLAPKTATVERGGIEQEIPVAEVLQGDIVVIRPGQSIPVDGVLIEGHSQVDESAITGESIPVEKKVGDTAIAATINKNGFFKFRATRVGQDTTLAQIVALVEEASASKAPIAKLADKVAGIFVPTVMTISLLTGIGWLLAGREAEFALSCAIAVLVISCPCALGLATPVAIMVGTGVGAKNGILIKNATALETFHSINTIVLDKTGTVTEGAPRVTDILTVGSRDHLLAVAAALETSSQHPLAEAVLVKAKELKIKAPECTAFENLEGMGISGMVDGKKCYGGNRRLMESIGIDLKAVESDAVRLAEEGKTPLFFAEEGKLLGVIAAADVVKPTSKTAIDRFKALGLEVVMLTGDNKTTAAAIGRQLGITQAIAEVLPGDKEKEIRRLQSEGKKVAMVGDGINDAPALVRADVGVAIGAGTDVAIESADVVLMKSDLLDAVTAYRLSRDVIRNIKQNLFWAFFYNSVGIPLAAGLLYNVFGIRLTPMFGAAAMSLSSVCVVSNALRLNFFKAEEKPHLSEVEAESRVIEDTNVVEIEGETTMTKTMKIEGMMCPHCSGRVEKALNALEGATAVVDLQAGTATVTMTAEISDEVLTKAVVDAGYEVTSIA